MTDEASREPARDPQDLERLLIFRQWAGDVDGMAALFEPHAVVDTGEGPLTLGRDAIRALFAEISTTTAGGPGDASTNITYLIFKQALLGFDVGVASAGALFAVVLAHIVAAFLIRLVGKNMDR